MNASILYIQTQYSAECDIVYPVYLSGCIADVCISDSQADNVYIDSASTTDAALQKLC